MNTLVAVGFFALSCYNDRLNVLWHEHREKGNAHAAGLVSLCMGAIGWAPLVLLVVSYNWQVIIADLLGNYVGSVWGVSRGAVGVPDPQDSLVSRLDDGQHPT